MLSWTLWFHRVLVNIMILFNKNGQKMLKHVCGTSPFRQNFVTSCKNFNFHCKFPSLKGLGFFAFLSTSLPPSYSPNKYSRYNVPFMICSSWHSVVHSYCGNVCLMEIKLSMIIVVLLFWWARRIGLVNFKLLICII